MDLSGLLTCRDACHWLENTTSLRSKLLAATTTTWMNSCYSAAFLFIMMRFSVVLLAVLASTSAFVSKSSMPSARAAQTHLFFGIPTFKPKDDKDDDKEEKKLTASGFIQLLTAGMGSPFLGEYEGTDKETGKMMFSLEANNLVDEEGRSKQTQMPFFESGWVDEEEVQRRKEGGFKFPWQK